MLDDTLLVDVAYAVGDAKYWDRQLDVRGESDQISNVPTDQIAFYMRHSGVTWGMLTNGRRWRLYHKGLGWGRWPAGVCARYA